MLQAEPVTVGSCLDRMPQPGMGPASSQAHGKGFATNSQQQSLPQWGVGWGVAWGKALPLALGSLYNEEVGPGVPPCPFSSLSPTSQTSPQASEPLKTGLENRVKGGRVSYHTLSVGWGWSWGLERRMA